MRLRLLVAVLSTVLLAWGLVARRGPGDPPARAPRDGGARVCEPEDPTASATAPEAAVPAGASLSGLIRDGRGKPVAGAYVFVRGREDCPTISDGEGRFRLEETHGEPAVLVVKAAGYGVTAVTVPGPSEDLAITLAPPGRTIVRLNGVRDVSELRGRLDRLDPRGDLIPAASAKILPGHDSTFDGMAPGSYALTLLAGEVLLDRRILVIESGATTPLSLSMR